MHASAQNVQKLYIELFFNQKLKNQFQSEPFKVLPEYSLTKNVLRQLPQVDSKCFNVESYGRRFLIAREILRCYQQFFKKLFNNKNVRFEDLIDSEIFNLFLESDYFYGNTFCFVHYAGVGRGYENSSKFFFFSLNYLKDYPVDSLRFELELELFSAIAAHLNSLAQLSDCDFFQQFKDVVIFEIQNKYFAVIAKQRVEISKQSAQRQKTILNTIINKIIHQSEHHNE